MKNINVLKKLAIILLFLSILLGLRMVWSKYISASEAPPIANGVLDLRGRELGNSDLFNLNGEWKFYPSQFISHADKPTVQHQPPSLLQVPGDWSQALDHPQHSAYGYGTYQLRILVDPLRHPISLWIKQIQSASAVEINGIEAGQTGTLARSAAEYRPSTRSYTASYFEKGTTEIEVLIRTANFDQPYQGGISEPIYFGTQEIVERTSFYAIGLLMLTAVILLLHSIYGGILFVFNPRERALFLVGMMTLSVAVILLVRNDNLIVQLLPISYTWAMKIRIIAFLWQNLFILLVFRKLISGVGMTKGLHLYIASLYLYTAFVIVAPASLISTTLHWGFLEVIQYLFLIWLIHSLWRLLLKKNDKDVVFLLLSGSAIISNLLWASFGRSAIVYYPWDIIAAIVGFSAYWFKQYFRNAKENMKLNEQLQKADKLKDQFLANTSHELRTPLHGIMNIAQNVVAKEDGRLQESSQQDMNLLITISQRMSHMLGDLLDVTRLQDHQIMLQQEPLLIQSVVPGVISMLNYMIEGKPVKLTMNIPESMPPVLADEKRLVQVLYNLIHNGLKFTKEGFVTVSAEVHEGRALIQVTDTGVGMIEETIARVLLPYEQGPHGIRDGRGIGLGLSISRQLVELHGGLLKLHSEPGSGSVFCFDLPLADAASPQESLSKVTPEAPTSDETRRQMAAWSLPELDNRKPAGLDTIPPLLSDSRVNILVVDDDPVNLNVLMGILANEPYDITAVHSAQEALEWVNKKQWGLLIADVMMPHMSGYELTQQVRERYSISELPILLLTARSQPADIYTGFLSGANDYVTKPVDALELRYRIRALTAMKQSIHERLRMEAAYLQAQIHPHFLFNTLNSIMSLSDLDTHKMQQLIAAFTSFLRISFDFLNTGELVSLSHELELVKAYLYIEQTRFSERLSVVWEVEQDIDILVPPLSIQPLTENAVKHGLLSLRHGGEVQIRIVREDQGVRIEVKDNGRGMDETTLAALLEPTMKEHQGIGLSNTHRRLMQLYGQGLSIKSQPGQGTTVSFLIPDNEEQ